MLLVADVHGAFDALAEVARRGETLLVLGDLLNFIDYRTNEGMLAEVAGKPFVARLTQMRDSGDRQGMRRMWSEFSSGREAEIRARYDDLIAVAYRKLARALDGADAYVTYGNVDRPDSLREALPSSATFVDGVVVDIEGYRVGFAGGGVVSLGVPGEVSDEDMVDKLDSLGAVDILCTHAAPAVAPLSRDVVGGRVKESEAVLAYLERHRPKWHYFGDIHQPQATTWRLGPTRCRNVGYFRATHRALRHEP